MQNNREWALELADKYESNEWGWTQGKMYEVQDNKDCFCLSGGIIMQLGGEISGECSCCVSMLGMTEREVELMRERMDEFTRYVGSYSVPEFNDHYANELPEVINALRRFAGEQPA